MKIKKKFKIFINVENVLTEIDGDLTRVGFYTTRIIKAVNMDDAMSKAKDLLYSEDKFKKIVQNDLSDPPSFKVDEINEIGVLESFKRKDLGYVFYKEELH